MYKYRLPRHGFRNRRRRGVAADDPARVVRAAQAVHRVGGRGTQGAAPQTQQCKSSNELDCFSLFLLSSKYYKCPLEHTLKYTRRLIES